MRFKIKYLLCALGVMAAMASCRIAPDDIRLEEVRDVQVEGVNLTQARVKLSLDMVNDSKMRVTVKEGELSLHDGSREVLEITIKEPVVLPRRSTTEVVVPLVIRFRGGLGALSGLSKLADHPENLLVSGSLHLKGAGLKKRYRINDMPLPDFLALIGVSNPQELDFFK